MPILITTQRGRKERFGWRRNSLLGGMGASGEMLLIHFTGADLARTQIAQEPDPMWETVLSLHILRNRAGRLTFRPWRDRARTAAPREVQALLGALVPPVGNFPDSLTPAAGLLGLDHGIEAMLSTPRQRLRRDVEQLPSLPAQLRGLGAGDSTVLRKVAAAFRSYHDRTLRPIWPMVRSAVRLDRSIRMRDAAHSGVEALLSALPWPIRWKPPVLVTDYSAIGTRTKHLHLDGRGLVIIPSYFCWREPVTLIDPELPPVLVYPVERRELTLETRLAEPSLAALAALLGPTRAVVLEALAESRTTSELARLLHISPSSASEHVAVLRNAGLVTSTRHANTVIHALTALGQALLSRTPTSEPWNASPPSPW